MNVHIAEARQHRHRVGVQPAHAARHGDLRFGPHGDHALANQEDHAVLEDRTSEPVQDPTSNEGERGLLSRDGERGQGQDDQGRKLFKRVGGPSPRRRSR